MERNNRWPGARRLAVLLPALLVLAALVTAGCAAGTGARGSRETRITVAGSTSVQPISEALAEAFSRKHPGIRVDVQGGGSSAGIRAVRDGVADIGASSRELKPEEKGLVEITIARDAIAVVVHPANPLDTLTIDQVKDVFAGRVRNWKDLGGLDLPILVVSREAGSGTRGAFEEIVMRGESVVGTAIIQNSTGAVRAAVAADTRAVGYVSLAAVTADLKALKIGGTAPGRQTVAAGSYALVRPFLYVLRKEPQGAVKTFIDFVLGPEGQAIIATEGLVPVR